jgi:hypothetical protein
MKAGNSHEAILYGMLEERPRSNMPISDKTRRQRKLDRVAFEILAAQHTKPETWMRWTDWFQLTKAKCGLSGLGTTTFTECTKRLLDQGRIKKSQVEKNRFYQAVFTLESSSGVRSEAGPGSENGGSGHDPVAPALDKAAQALAFLLNRKPPGVV